MKTPKPRIARFMGMVEEAHIAPDGTWLEAESMCYPSGAMLRRACAVCEDGSKRVVTCGMPDTYFSIPARARIKGKSVRGFVTSSDSGGYQFVAYKTS